MSSRFLILTPHSNDTYRVLHDFEAREASIATTAFRALYGERRGVLLFEQVAVSEPTGSRDEADDSSRQAGILKDFAGLS